MAAVGHHRYVKTRNVIVVKVTTVYTNGRISVIDRNVLLDTVNVYVSKSVVECSLL